MDSKWHYVHGMGNHYVRSHECIIGHICIAKHKIIVVTTKFGTHCPMAESASMVWTRLLWDSRKILVLSIHLRVFDLFLPKIPTGATTLFEADNVMIYTYAYTCACMLFPTQPMLHSKLFKSNQAFAKSPNTIDQLLVNNFIPCSRWRLGEWINYYIPHLLGMWLLIHAGTKVNLCQWKGPQDASHNEIRYNGCT